jgi:hypothetical protein
MRYRPAGPRLLLLALGGRGTPDGWRWRERQGFADPQSRSDQQVGERSIRLAAAAEVARNLLEPQVVHLAMLGGQLDPIPMTRLRGGRIARDQPVLFGVPQGKAEHHERVVDRLRAVALTGYELGDVAPHVRRRDRSQSPLAEERLSLSRPCVS